MQRDKEPLYDDYTSRYNIINWINYILSLNIEKLQQLYTGAIYCQLLDAAYPDRIYLSKLNWNPINQSQIVHNYKILIDALDHLGYTKFFNIERLMKKKYQDHLALSKWLMKTFAEKICQNNKNQIYQAQIKRNYVRVKISSNSKKSAHCYNNHHIHKRSREKLTKVKLISKKQKEEKSGQLSMMNSSFQKKSKNSTENLRKKINFQKINGKRVNLLLKSKKRNQKLRQDQQFDADEQQYNKSDNPKKRTIQVQMQTPNPKKISQILIQYRKSQTLFTVME